MKQQISRLLAEAISSNSGLAYEKVFPLIEKPKNPEFGDLAFPCFLLGKLWKLSPPDAAKKLAAELTPPQSIEGIIATGPFLNFRIKRGTFIAETVNKINGTKIEQYLKSILPNSDCVVLEYSSPNIAKPFHVGHLRATLIGNSLDRLYRKLGFKTISINHLGDWGTQFGFVWAGCKIWGKPELPSVKTLVELYKKATSLKEQQESANCPSESQSLPEVNLMAREFFLDLEQEKDYAIEFWKWCSEISLDYLKQTYLRLGVSFDHYTGESFYSDKLNQVKDELEKSGLLVESQGALGVDLGEKLGFARIFTPDGRSLYLTRDLATAKYRAETFKFDRALYVVGAPQSLHFQQIMGVLKALGRDYAEKIEHVSFGHVLGVKTRGGGEILELNEFIDEAVDRALTAYREQVSKRPEGLDETKVAEGVALAAIIFSNLSRNRIKDVHFSWDHALEFQGDSGPYLLYAYARINGISEKATEAGLKSKSSIESNEIEEESAFQLASVLDDFPAALTRTLEDNDPANIASYALDLAKAFSRAYNELHVLGVAPETSSARLSLFEATKTILKEALLMLGIKQPLERM